MGKELLHSALRAKERQIQSKKASSDSPPVDIIDEDCVLKEIDGIEKRIQDSGLSGTYKKKIHQKLSESINEWQKSVEQIEADAEAELKRLFQSVQESLAAFERQENVRSFFILIEPFFAHKNEIQDILSISSYVRRSGNWKQINHHLAIFGFNEEKIKNLQKFLKIRVDGKVGPETILAIYEKIYEEPKTIQWSSKTTHANQTDQEFRNRALTAQRATQDEEWQTVERDYDLEIKNAKTFSDISQAEAKMITAKQRIYSRFASIPVAPQINAARPGNTQAGSPTISPSRDATPHIPEQSEIDNSIKFLESLNRKFALALSPTAAQIYANAYAKLAPAKRNSPEVIESELLKIADFLPAGDESYRQKKLTKALGILINGGEIEQDSAFFEENIERIGLNMATIQARVGELQEKLEKLQKLKPYKLLEEAVKLNDSWFADASWSIDQSVHTSRQVNKYIGETKETLEKSLGEILEFKQSLYLNLYFKVKSEGGDTDALLVAIFEDLGDNVPETIKGEVEAAKARKIAAPETSEFDKLFYQGKYQEAMNLLASQNRGRDTVGNESWGKFNDAEIYSMYRDIIDNKSGANAGTSATLTKLLGRNFAGDKLKEGYIPLFRFNNKGQILGDSVNSVDGYVIAKQREDGSLSVHQVNFDGWPVGERGFVPSHEAKEHIITPTGAERSEVLGGEIETNFGRLTSKVPSFNRLAKASEDIRDKFIPLQQLFVAGAAGKKTADFVAHAKSYAREIKGSTALADLKANINEARSDLALLKSLPSGSTEKFEAQIREMEQAFSQITKLVEGGTIDYFCDQVINPSFSEDTAGSWLIKEGIVMLSAIAVAVTAVVVVMAVVGTGGIAGIAGLALVSAVSGAGVIIGSEVGHVISEKVGEWAYGDEFTNRSLLGKYLKDEKMLDPKTGELRPIDGMDLGKVYGQQFAIAFITTFGLLVAGRIVGLWLSKFATNNANVGGLSGRAAELLNKLPRFKPQELDLLAKSKGKNLATRILKEFFEETGEESVEAIAERLHPVSGFFAQLAFCVSGGKVKYALGKHRVAMEGTQQTGNEVLSTFKYDVSQSDSIPSAIKTAYEAQGFKVTIDPDGTVRAESEITLKNGETAKAITVFKPTTENIAMLEAMGDAKPYGLKSVGENNYEFATMSPKGKLNLKSYLEKQGFIVQEMSDGTFEARMGEEVVRLRRTETRTDAQLLNEIHDPSLKSATQRMIDDLWKNINGRWQNVEWMEGLRHRYANMKARANEIGNSLWSKIEARFRIVTEWSSNLANQTIEFGRQRYPVWSANFETALQGAITKISNANIRSACNNLLSQMQSGVTTTLDLAGQSMGKYWRGAINMSSTAWQRITRDWDSLKPGLNKANAALGKAMDSFMSAISKKRIEIRTPNNQNLSEVRERRMNPERKEYNEVHRETPRPQHDFDDGDTVRFSSPDGTKAAGLIVGVDETTGHFVIVRKKNGKVIERIHASKEQLNEWNPEGPFRHIKTSAEIIAGARKLSPQPQLTEELIRSDIFKIEKTINISTSKFHIGPILRRPSGRLFAIMLVDTGDGRLLPRIMYKSTSQGGWRVTPGHFTRDGKDHYSKGKFPLFAYTHETILVPKIADYLETVEQKSRIQEISFDPVQEYFALASPLVKSIRTYDKEVVDVREPLLELFLAKGYDPGGLTATDATVYFRSLDQNYPPGFIPDFSKGPKTRKEKNHSSLGKIISETYNASLPTGRMVEWAISYEAKDNPKGQGRVWIEAIRIIPQSINSYGIEGNVLFTGLLTHKPLEYYKQSGGLRDGTEKVEFNSSYVDITPLLDNLLPIRQFRNARGIHRPAEKGRPQAI